MMGPTANSGRPRAPGARPAFTLFELVGVMVILGILAAAAIPAVTRITGFGVEAVRAEVSSSLVFAREVAASTGTPTGVRIDLTSQEMSYVQIVAPGASPTTMVDASGVPRRAVKIDRHGGPRVDSVTGSGPGNGGSIVWFGHAGVPEQRTSGGGYLQAAPGDITLTFTSGQPLTVHAHTGVVE